MPCSRGSSRPGDRTQISCTQADSLLCEQEILGYKLHKGKDFCFLGFVSLLIFSVLYPLGQQFSRLSTPYPFMDKVGGGEFVSTIPNHRNICEYLGVGKDS